MCCVVHGKCMCGVVSEMRVHVCNMLFCCVVYCVSCVVYYVCAVMCLLCIVCMVHACIVSCVYCMVMCV